MKARSRRPSGRPPTAGSQLCACTTAPTTGRTSASLGRPRCARISRRLCGRFAGHRSAPRAVNVFKPFYFAGQAVPPNYAIGKDNYSRIHPGGGRKDSSGSGDLNYNKLAPVARAVFRETEQWALAKSRRIEAEAARVRSAGREAEAQAVLRDFSRECCARIEREYARLHVVMEKNAARGRGRLSLGGSTARNVAGRTV